MRKERERERKKSIFSSPDNEMETMHHDLIERGYPVNTHNFPEKLAIPKERGKSLYLLFLSWKILLLARLLPMNCI